MKYGGVNIDYHGADYVKINTFLGCMIWDILNELSFASYVFYCYLYEKIKLHVFIRKYRSSNFSCYFFLALVYHFGKNALHLKGFIIRTLKQY